MENEMFQIPGFSKIPLADMTPRYLKKGQLGQFQTVRYHIDSLPLTLVIC